MKGLCKIQLIDNDTGKIVQETQDENMVTDAINRVLNPPPIFFAESRNSEYYDYIHNFMKSIDQTLGGVMLWSEQIPEDVNTIYPPNPNAQVGYAGNDAYTGDNTFRGSYNALESGKTDTGYKFVWDFPTSQANGTIRCVTLTSGMGGRCGWGGSHESSIDCGVGNMFYAPVEVSGIPDYVSSGTLVGMYKENILTFAKSNGKELILKDVELPIYNMKTKSESIFSNSISRNYKNVSTKKLIADTNWNRVCTFFRCKDFFVSCATENYIDINYIKVDGRTKSIVTQKKITLTNGRKCAYLANQSEQFYVEFNGFLYIMSDNHMKIYKIDINNPANIKDIVVPPYNKSYLHFFVLNNQIALTNNSGNNKDARAWFINKEDEFIPTYFYAVGWSSCRSGIIETEFIKPPFYFYAAEDAYDRETTVLPVLITPYIATIDNLASPVTKTASQSMKVIYTLTDV